MTEIESKIYSSLSTRSRRSLMATKYRIGKKWGKRKSYSPRYTLLDRLARKFAISQLEVYNALQSIRKELLKTLDQGF